MYIISYTLITEDFPGLRKTDGEKRKTSEDIVSKTLLSMTQYNFRTRQGPNFFSVHSDKVGTVSASRYAHSSCARMTRGAKTGYTTSLTSVTRPNSWRTYRAYSTGFCHDFFRVFFLSIFRVPGKTSVYQGKFLVLKSQLHLLAVSYCTFC